MTKKYCINPLYRARTEYHHWDDSSWEDQWQLEVYLHVLGLMKKHTLHSIVDIGCGSAYKLVTYLGDYHTIGFELPANVAMLREKYPQRQWRVAEFSTQPDLTTDVVICADVIEHLCDPDELLHFIKGIAYKYLVLSTPARNILYRRWNPRHYGPPKSIGHVREWTYHEFGNYISTHFDVIDHRVTNLFQSTQMMICKPKRSCHL